MKTILYLGSDPSHFKALGKIIHYPVIQIIPRSKEAPEIKSVFEDLPEYTHLIFTSKHAVFIFFNRLEDFGGNQVDLLQKYVVAIGRTTAQALLTHGITPSLIAEEETQEGIVRELRLHFLDEAYVFLPRSSLSRPIIVNFFHERLIRYQACDLYDTLPQKIDPVPDLQEIDEIVFTSPSTVRAFLQIYPVIPSDKQITTLGPITKAVLKEFALYTI